MNRVGTLYDLPQIRAVSPETLRPEIIRDARALDRSHACTQCRMTRREPAHPNVESITRKRTARQLFRMRMRFQDFEPFAAQSAEISERSRDRIRTDDLAGHYRFSLQCRTRHRHAEPL